MSKLYTSIKNLLLTICPMYHVLTEYPDEVYIDIKLDGDPYAMLRIRDYSDHSEVQLHKRLYYSQKDYLAPFIQVLKELYEVKCSIEGTRVSWTIGDKHAKKR